MLQTILYKCKKATSRTEILTINRRVENKRLPNSELTVTDFFYRLLLGKPLGKKPTTLPYDFVQSFYKLD